MRRRFRLFPLLFVLASCEGAWTDLDAAHLGPEQRAQRERAIAARNELSADLIAALGEAVLSGGPARAISVCSESARSIAESVSRRSGLRIGRTSNRLRNRDNAPPAWAKDAIARSPQAEVLRAGPRGELCALFPIRIQAPCLACHGPRQGIDGAVRSALARLYPDDRATGYALNDLRGWFWVEVPR
ncbi:MAG: DUF3365 domain-containing protein [Planctomycetota bacterium]